MVSGISFDHNWLRFLGGGSVQVPFDLTYDWPRKEFVVAYDAVGGFFALRGKSSFYLAPDTLDWKDMKRGYSHLLHWAATGDLKQFYANLRWPGWHDEVAALPGDRALYIYPPPFMREGKDPSQCSRRAVPVLELWNVHSTRYNGQL